MATEKYMVEFRIMDDIAILDYMPDSTPGVINQIIHYTLLDQVDEIGYHADHGEVFDNGDDSDDTLAQTDTLVTIRFEVEEDAVEWEFPDDSLYALALQSLNNPNAHVSNSYRKEIGPYSRTYVEITTYEVQ